MDEMDCRYRADSIFMNILRSAMENAHKKVHSTVAPIECLNETYKFYELAIIQIDASLKLIKELEPKDQIPETTTRIKILSDLIKLKDLLHERLNYTKCSIIEKDKELMKRLENEIRLKQALDSKEKELASLRSEIKLNSEPELQSFQEDMIMSIGDLTKTEKNRLMEQMSSDLDNLKELLHLTFDQIHKNEVRDLDQQWRCSIEKETILIMIKGFINNQSVEYYKNQNKDAIIERLMEEQQESSLQTMAMEEHYMILLNDCYKEFWGSDVEMQFKEDVFVYVLHEVAKDWCIYDENQSIKMQLKDEIYKSVFVEIMNDIQMKLDFELQKIRNEELVYKKAFARRCENLLLAETEVDLLGDQVEALQNLLKKIYFLLDRNLSVLSTDSQVREILKLIKKEFNS